MRLSGISLALIVLLSLLAPSHASTNSPALTKHLSTLKPPPDFTVVIQPPFVVLGDESPAEVQRHATRTIKFAVDQLKQLYFTNDPTEIIDIWLFKDAASYTNHARSLFGDTPTTKFGYYSSQHHALIMNISTGGGTLVHEIVHPFIAANFPNCPPWFNEGLASLYEASTVKSNQIWGTINWRYKGLEQAITNKQTISFEKLTGLDEDEFYGTGTANNYSSYYAQSRYLLYYLQEKGLLVKFYHEFRAHSKTDPTGYQTLQKVLNERDMTAFQKKWEQYILNLRSP
jgi:Protein of unknown function (DUF1570)